MRGTWTVITLLFALIGFAFPLLWGVAILTAVFAVASAPAGRRADGKPRSGGLLGGVVDAAVVAAKMKDCVACKAKIPKEATRCQHCTAEQPEPPDEPRQEAAPPKPAPKRPTGSSRRAY